MAEVSLFCDEEKVVFADCQRIEPEPFAAAAKDRIAAPVRYSGDLGICVPAFLTEKTACFETGFIIRDRDIAVDEQEKEANKDEGFKNT